MFARLGSPQRKAEGSTSHPVEGFRMAVVRRLLLALVVGLMWTIPVSAQEVTGIVRGRVIDAGTQQPLPDVQVTVEGTRRRAVTGPDGGFIIVGVEPGLHRVRASRIGHAPAEQIVTVVGSSTLDVPFALERRAIALQDVVTVGYGTQKRQAITGSIATVDADAANVGIVPNVNAMIQGRAAGVNVVTNSGEPGSGAQILIRGGSSISASNEPLYVIDGIPLNNVEIESVGLQNPGSPGNPSNAPLPRSPLNLINPADIASISILKDASASAIYGSRAANGVVLIETKKGTAGGPSVEYEVQVGSSSLRSHLNVLSGDQYRTFIQDQVAINQACRANPPAGADSVGARCAPFGLHPSRLTSLGTASTNWESQITRRAPTLQHNFSFAGGGPETQYRASLSYLDQQGVVLNNGMKRYTGRLNSIHNAMDGALRFGLNLTASQVQDTYIYSDNTTGFEGGVFVNMIAFNPTLPAYVVDPATGITSFYETGPGKQSNRNPLALTQQIQDRGKSLRTFGNLSADYDIFSSLTARVNLGVDRAEGRRGTYLPRISPIGAEWTGRAQQSNRDLTSRTLQTQLTFRHAITGNQDFEMIGGYEYNDYDLAEFKAESRNFVTDDLGYNNLGAGATTVTPTSFDEHSRLVGFYSRANWNFADRFYLTGVWRRDGSSRFGIGNKWAVFPGISGAWRISEESFMKGRPLSELRLRAGWGKQGNPGVPPYASLLVLGPSGNSYVFGEQAFTGFAPTRNANPNLKWEASAQTNVALDYGFLQNRILGSLEYYVKNTKDLIFEVNVPQPAPVSTRLENVGRLQNKGVEFSLDGTVITRPDLTWSAGFNLSHDKSKVVELGGGRTFLTNGRVSGQGQSDTRSERLLPGEEIGTFYGAEFAGWGPNGIELFNHYVVTREAGTNKILTRVLTGTTATPGEDDYTIIGHANPKYTLGFHSNATWRAFDFSISVARQSGMQVFNNTALVYATKSNALQDKNFLAVALTDSTNLRQPARYSSRWIEDGSFTRLQNITVGYTFDVPGLGGQFKGARVFLSGDNLLLGTNYSGYDPEVHTDARIGGVAERGTDFLNYPRPRTVTGGIRVRF
jgi:TonB-dependent starch-binding outer membrane protein SusC